MVLRRIAFAQIEELVKAAASELGESSCAEDGFAFFGGHFFAESEDGMTEYEQKVEREIVIRAKMGFFRSVEAMTGLAEAEPVVAEFAFDLRR